MLRYVARPLQRPERNDLPPEDRAAYDELLAIDERTRAQHASARTAAEYRSALLHAPTLALTYETQREAIRAAERRGWFTAFDREFAHLVLSFHLGYSGVLGVHLPQAATAGVRAEALAALRSGDDGALTSG